MDCFRLRSSSYGGHVVASLLAMTIIIWAVTVSLRPERLQHEIHDMLAAGALGGGAAEIGTEDRRQRRRVGEEEIGEARNRDVEMHGIDAAPEHALAYPLFQDLVDQADQRRMHSLDLARAADMAGAAAIFVVEQHDEVGVGGEMVEGAFDQLLDRLFRRKPLQIKFALLRADFLVDPFQHGEIERILVAEIMINELLVDAGAGRDLVNPRAGKPAVGKFAPRRGKELLPGGFRVAPLRPLAVRSSFKHFQPNS